MGGTARIVYLNNTFATTLTLRNTGCISHENFVYVMERTIINLSLNFSLTASRAFRTSHQRKWLPDGKLPDGECWSKSDMWRLNGWLAGMKDNGVIKSFVCTNGCRTVQATHNGMIASVFPVPATTMTHGWFTNRDGGTYSCKCR